MDAPRRLSSRLEARARNSLKLHQTSSIAEGKEQYEAITGKKESEIAKIHALHKERQEREKLYENIGGANSYYAARAKERAREQGG